MTGSTIQAGKRAAYPAYKPSGVPWLGDVPEHWQPVRLRYRAKVNPTRSELNGTPGDLDVSFVPMESVHEYGGLTLDQTRPLAEVATGYTYFRDGDVLAAKITPCFENGKGSIADGLVNGIGFGTTELHVLRPYPDLDRRFLFYVTISHAFRRLGAAEMYGAGGQKRVPDDFIRDFRQPIPSSDEQKAIAAFLDRETARGNPGTVTGFFEDDKGSPVLGTGTDAEIADTTGSTRSTRGPRTAARCTWNSNTSPICRSSVLIVPFRRGVCAALGHGSHIEQGRSRPDPD